MEDAWNFHRKFILIESGKETGIQNQFDIVNTKYDAPNHRNATLFAIPYLAIYRNCTSRKML